MIGYIVNEFLEKWVGKNGAFLSKCIFKNSPLILGKPTEKWLFKNQDIVDLQY